MMSEGLAIDELGFVDGRLACGGSMNGFGKAIEKSRHGGDF